MRITWPHILIAMVGFEWMMEVAKIRFNNSLLLRVKYFVRHYVSIDFRRDFITVNIFFPLLRRWYARHLTTKELVVRFNTSINTIHADYNARKDF